MSATQKNILAVALMLAAVVGSATPAAAQRGIEVDIPNTDFSAWTLTVINLTDYPLSLVTNSVQASGGQRPPFWGNTLNGQAAFPLAPYRNVTWKSNTSNVFYPNPHWNGTLTFLPQGMDPKWTVTLNFAEYPPTNSYETWVYLTADFNANPDWQDTAYNISCSYPDWYNSRYNVMTLSGTDLVVSLYAPHINIGPVPNVDATLVFRQRWPHTTYKDAYQDSLVMPCLRFQDYSIN
jgi:hypothetical protein